MFSDDLKNVFVTNTNRMYNRLFTHLMSRTFLTIPASASVATLLSPLYGLADGGVTRLNICVTAKCSTFLKSRCISDRWCLVYSLTTRSQKTIRRASRSCLKMIANLALCISLSFGPRHLFHLGTRLSVEFSSFVSDTNTSTKNKIHLCYLRRKRKSKKKLTYVME